MFADKGKWAIQMLNMIKLPDLLGIFRRSSRVSDQSGPCPPEDSPSCHHITPTSKVEEWAGGSTPHCSACCYKHSGSVHFLPVESLTNLWIAMGWWLWWPPQLLYCTVWGHPWTLSTSDSAVPNVLLSGVPSAEFYPRSPSSLAPAFVPGK